MQLFTLHLLREFMRNTRVRVSQALEGGHTQDITRDCDKIT